MNTIAPDTARQSAATPWAQRIAAPVVAVLEHPWVESIIRHGTVEDVLRSLHPMLSLTEVRARVVRVVRETPDTQTLVLHPNALWRGAQAGQFVSVQLEIDGRRVTRVYSLSSRPGPRRIAITVRRQQGGLVSQHLHDHIKVGDVLTLSQAAGEFVLPDGVLPPKMLLLSAGSGITPIMAMLRQLAMRRHDGDVVLLHVCRSPEDFIFSAQVQALLHSLPRLKLITWFSQSSGRMSPGALQAAVPDLAQRETWVCGPSGLMDAVAQLWADADISARLHSERFSAAPLRCASTPGAPVAVAFTASGKSFQTSGDAPLLAQAERAGLSPKHGCRIGICRSCQCTKTSGTVQNLQTGAVSSAPNELIRLCISVARTDLAIAL